MMRRSLGIRHLSCGSCNGCEHEVNALGNAYYDITQEGWDIVASPRHADVVTVTGPVTETMRDAARSTLEATPRPYIVVAVGDCALGKGPWAGAAGGRPRRRRRVRSDGAGRRLPAGSGGDPFGIGRGRTFQRIAGATP